MLVRTRTVDSMLCEDMTIADIPDRPVERKLALGGYSTYIE